MDTTFSVEASFPPSLAGMPILAMLTQMAFWAVTLLCLQWIYSILDDTHDHPAPRESYIGISRAVKLRLLIAALALTFPRLLLLVAWQKLSPVWREGLALASWVVLVPCAVTMAIAWWKDRGTRPTDRLLTGRTRFVELTPATVQEKTRGMIGLALIFVIAFATTFVRLEPGHAPPRHIPVELR